MYWYINKHVEPENGLDAYDVILERFDDETTAQMFLGQNYLPFKVRPGVRESIDVRASYEDQGANFDLKKPMVYQIWESAYLDGTNTPREKFATLEEAEKTLESTYLPNAHHAEEDDISYRISKENE